MGVSAIRKDGTVTGVLSELIVMHGSGEIESMILIIEKKGQVYPFIAFCETSHPTIELGLLELAKIQALRTRDIL